jgi:PAS domain S-box-containing protein
VIEPVKRTPLPTYLSRLIWVSLLPLILLAGWFGFDRVRNLHADQTREAEHAVAHARDEIDRYLQTRLTALEILANSPLLHEYPNLEFFHRRAQEFRRKFDGHLVLADTELQMLLNTRAPFGAALPRLPQPAQGAVAPQVLASGQAMVGNIVRGPVAGQPLIPIVAPVKRAGKVTHLLVATFELAFFERLLDESWLQPGITLSLLDGQQGIIAARGAATTDPADAAAHEFVAHSELSSWRVQLTIPASTHAAPVNTVIREVVILLLLAILAGWAGGRWAGRRLGKAVTALTRENNAATDSGAVEETHTAHELIHTQRLQLRASEQRYRSLFENQHTAMLLIDPMDGRIVDANPAAEVFYGWPRDTLKTKSIQEINTLSQAEVARHMEAARKYDRNIFHFHHRIASGEIRDVEVHSGPVRLDDRMLLYSIIHDETERLMAERRLQEALSSATRFSEALDQVDAYVYMKDRESRYLYGNRATQNILDVSAEELIGAIPENFFTPDVAAGIRSSDRRVLAGERIAEEAAYLMPDGQRHVFWEIKSPIFVTHQDGSRELWGISGISTDITHLKNTELELHQALQVVEASPVVSFRWLPKEGWPVGYVSKNVSRWGYSATDILAGVPAYSELIHPEDLQRVNDEMATHTNNGDAAYTQIYRIRAADGHYFWVEDNTHVIRDENGELVAYEGVVSDIDTLKRYEQELAANLTEQKALYKKLEAAQNQLLQSEKMASLGQLAAGVAHELNNPIGFVNSNLNTLEGYLKDLFSIADAYTTAEVAYGLHSPLLDHAHALKQEKDYDFLRSDIFQLVNESRDGLHRVARIVRNLKDFSRAGDAAMRWADLHAGLDSTLNIVWNELKYKCTVTKHYGELPQVWCEPSQINQVFMNLLVNAGHAIDDKGEITITTGQQGEEVFIAIADTGSGIAPEDIKRIFDPFFTTKPVGKGTGLGLSLAYGIVQKHIGRIEVQSELGKGTTFTVWLPIKPPDENQCAVPPAPTPEKP